MIFINLTYGFGNNLFQFHFTRLVANKLNTSFYCTGKVSKYFSKFKREPSLGCFIIKDKTFDNKRRNINEIINEIKKNIQKDILLKGFFEYEKFFFENRKNIIDFHFYNDFIFSKNSFKIESDLNIIHIRLNNRLVQLNHSLRWIDPEKFLNLIFKQFPDLTKWRIISDFNFNTDNIVEDIENLRRENFDGPNKFTILVPKKEAIRYVNRWIEVIRNNKKLIYINDGSSESFIRKSGGLKNNFLEDFELLMKSRNIIFWSSTYSWWASFLSNKSNIFIGSPWRMDRSKKLDPSLDEINLPNKINFDLRSIVYDDHIKKNISIYLYNKIPYRIRSIYSKMLNFIYRKLNEFT